MVMERVEKSLGLPRLSALTQTLEKLPDEKQLRLLYKVLQLADKLSEHAPDLNQVIALIREVNALPVEKLERTEKLLKQIEKIMSKAPQELLDFLTSLKE